MDDSEDNNYCIYTISAGTYKDVRMCELKAYFKIRSTIISQSSNEKNRTYNTELSKCIRDVGWNENMIKIKSIHTEKEAIKQLIKEREKLGLDMKPIDAAEEILKDEEKEKYLSLLKERNEKMKIKQEISKEKYKEAKKEKAKEKITCECGGHYTYSNKNVHLCSMKHIKWLEKQIVPAASP